MLVRAINREKLLSSVGDSGLSTVHGRASGRRRDSHVFTAQLPGVYARSPLPFTWVAENQPEGKG